MYLFLCVLWSTVAASEPIYACWKAEIIANKHVGVILSKELVTS